MNRRGNAVLTGVTLLVLLFVLSLTAIFIHFTILAPINTAVQEDADFSAQAKSISSSTSSGFTTNWDFAIPVIFAIAWIVSLVLAVDLESNAVFFGLSVFVMFVVISAAMGLAVFYDDLSQDSDYSTLAIDFPWTNFMVRNIVPLITVVMFSVAGVLYAKR